MKANTWLAVRLVASAYAAVAQRWPETTTACTVGYLAGLHVALIFLLLF